MAELDPTTLKESETVELKESFNKDALQTLCAFANTKGGTLYIGIKDDSTLLGGTISDEVQQKYINQIEDGLGVQPEVSVHEQEGNEFLEIKVKKSKHPVSYRGKYYKRVGNTTRELDPESLRTMFLKDIAWDSLTNDKFSLDEINNKTWTSIAARARGQRGIPEFDEIGQDEFLQHLNLLVDGELTNAAMVLFGENPQKYFPYATIRIGRFKDESTILADHRIEGNLFNQMQRSEQIIKSLINKRYEITGESFMRKDVWDYPLEALREALLNAIVHRDYHNKRTEIQIKIFDDRIWFWNPGLLPDELSIERLKQPHPSIRRNPLIADVFFRAGYIEQYGSGIFRMMEALRAEGHAEPEFEEQANGFVTLLFSKHTTWIHPDLSEVLNDRQIKSVNYVKEHGSIDNKTYRTINDVSRQTASRDLSEMIEKGFFEQRGEGPQTHYVLK